MDKNELIEQTGEQQDYRDVPFYERKGVYVRQVKVGGGVPFGYEVVQNIGVGIGGVYGAWGKSYDNESLIPFIENRIGEAMFEGEAMKLDDLGFMFRHHTPLLSDEEDYELELEVGSTLLREAARACGWDISEVDAVLIGMSGPISKDFVDEISHKAGIRENALKVSVHKACDGSVGSLHLSLNPALSPKGEGNIADKLAGKKVLVGGFEGLSRFIRHSNDKLAMQLFGNGAGVIGIIPGENMKFLVGKNHEVFDEEGVLAVKMYYPHSRLRVPGQSLVEYSVNDANHIRVAGMMNEPGNGQPIAMSGPMGMVKLFVRSGVEVVTEVFRAYQEMMGKIGLPDKRIAVAIVHHANYKINRLKEKTLSKDGIPLSMPWVVNDFGNVSAASNMIAFLRKLPEFSRGDHILFDGFGAGTYYDVLAVQLS